MKLSKAIESYQKYHSFNSKKNTIKNYEFLFSRFKEEFGNTDLESITPDEILSFLTRKYGDVRSFSLFTLFQ
jgi:hypothetical protein